MQKGFCPKFGSRTLRFTAVDGCVGCAPLPLRDNPICHLTVGDDFFLRSGGAHSALTFTCVNIGI